MQRKGVLVFLGVTLVAVQLTGAGGCRQGVRSGDVAPRADLSAFYQDLFREAGLSGWQAEEEPDVGVGLEGLYRLVNGAAESFWERGVTRAAFQEFSSGGGWEVLEIHRFSFRSSDDAERFYQQTCREDRGKPGRTGTASCCRFTGGPLNRALVRQGMAVYDLQLYGIPVSDHDPVTQLVKAFGRSQGGGDTAH